MQEHLATSEQQWTDPADGRRLPTHDPHVVDHASRVVRIADGALT